MSICRMSTVQQCFPSGPWETEVHHLSKRCEIISIEESCASLGLAREEPFALEITSYYFPFKLGVINLASNTENSSYA